MIEVNQPKNELIEVKCYKCHEIFKVHPMQSSTSPFIVDCDLHNSKKLKED